MVCSGGCPPATRRGCVHRARFQLIPGRIRAGGPRGRRRRRSPLPRGADGARRTPARLQRRARLRLPLRARIPAHRHASGASSTAAIAG
jgi:hypothetical protein